MTKDRMMVYETISELLDNPDSSGVYLTTRCYDKLVRYIEQQRMEAIGWTYAKACVTLDRGLDIREIEVPKIIAQAKRDLSK